MSSRALFTFALGDNKIILIGDVGIKSGNLLQIYKKGMKNRPGRKKCNEEEQEEKKKKNHCIGSPRTKNSQEVSQPLFIPIKSCMTRQRQKKKEQENCLQLPATQGWVVRAQLRMPDTLFVSNAILYIYFVTHIFFLVKYAISL